MTLKNSKTVALDKRYDLASLFCMIGRHGPAVAMAMLAMISVLAAFIIYRSVKGKRRKATAAESDNKTAGAEKDAAVIHSGQEPSQEETHDSVESTEERDRASPDLLEEDADLIQDYLETEESCAAAAAAVAAEDSCAVLEAVERKPPLCSSPKSENQTPDDQHIKNDHREEMEAASQSPECEINTCNTPEMYTEEVTQKSQCDADIEAEIIDKGVVECHCDAMENAEDETVKNAVEESRDNESCLKEPESIDYESCHEEEQEKVCKAEYEELVESAHPDEHMTTDMKSGKGDEDVQCAMKELLSQTPHINEDGDDDRLTDNKTRQEKEDLKELVVCIPQVKDEKYESDHDWSDNMDLNYCRNAHFPVKEEKKDEAKEEEDEECAECVDYQLIAQQAEVWDPTTEQEVNLTVSQLPSIYQQQLNEQHNTDKDTPSSWDSDEDVVLAGQVIEEDIYEDIDQLKNCPTVAYDPNLPCLNEQQLEIEQKDENHHPTCNQEEHVLPAVADQLKEKTVASDDVATSISEARDNSSVLLSPLLPSLNPPSEQDKDDKDENGPAGIITDAEGHISSIAYCPHVSSSCEQLQQKEDKDENAPSVDEHAPINMHDPHVPSCDREIQSQKNNNGTAQILDEDDNALVCDPHQSSLYQDQEHDHVINKETLDKASISADPNMVACNAENIPAPVMAEEMPGPRQQNGHTVNDEGFEKADVAAGHDATACGVENITAPVTSDETSSPCLLSCYQDQQKDHIVKNEALDEANVAASLIVAPCDGENVPASIMAEEKSHPPLPSFYQDQESDHVANNEAFEMGSTSAGTDAAVCDVDNITGPVTAEETSVPPLPTFYQDSDYLVNNEAAVAAVEKVAAPVMAEVNNPSVYQLHLPSFDQLSANEQRVNDDGSTLSPGVDDESGISSMTFSPDLHSAPFCREADEEYDISAPTTEEDLGLPVLDFDPYLPACHQPMETYHSQYIDDISKPVIKADGGFTGMVFGPYPTPVYQQHHSERTDQTICEAFEGNDDVMGQVIEDMYSKQMDKFCGQIAVTVTSFTDELSKQTEVKDSVEMKEKKERVSVDKKEDEKEEDYEKTEISIMEATMDNNEWITDGNYQTLPWVNFSPPSSAQNHMKTDQLPTEEHQHDDSTDPAAEKDAATVETATDITPSTEANQTSTLSDENAENKMVVAVQPMPQNVSVTFCVHYLTHSPSQMVAVTGNQQALGSWKGFIPLERAKDGYWASVINLPAESHVEWKFVLVDEGEVCRWEECDNRFLDTGCGDNLHVHKWWGFL